MRKKKDFPLRKIEREFDAADEAFQEDDFPATEKHLLKAIALAEKHTPNDLYEICCLKHLLTAAYRGMNRDEEALALSLEILPVIERVTEPSDPHLSGVLDTIGEVIMIDGRPKEALPYFERTLQAQRQLLEALILDEDDDRRLAVAENLGHTLLNLIVAHAELHQTKQMMDYVEEALAFIPVHVPGELLLNFADVLLGNELWAPANELLAQYCTETMELLQAPVDESSESALERMEFERIQQTHLKTGAVPITLLRARIRLALVALNYEDQTEALDPVPELLNLTGDIENLEGMEVLSLLSPLTQLAAELHALAKLSGNPAHFAAAEEQHNTAAAVLRKHLPADDPDCAEALKLMDQLFQEIGRGSGDAAE
jgi:tetratricopeptide (TPR) repeat protein